MLPLSIDEAISDALLFERRVLGVYQEAAVASMEEIPRRVFGALAAEEAEHVA